MKVYSSPVDLSKSAVIVGFPAGGDTVVFSEDLSQEEDGGETSFVGCTLAQSPVES